MTTTPIDSKELCVRATHMMADGALADFEAVVHHETRNREDVDEPPASRYDADARPAQAFPPTGRTFATTQTYWFRIADEKVIEHWANRDDLSAAMQLGWTPPSPLYLARMLLASRRAPQEAGR